MFIEVLFLIAQIENIPKDIDKRTAKNLWRIHLYNWILLNK